MPAVSAAVVAAITNAIANLLDDTLDTVSAVADNSCIWKKVSISTLAWRIAKDEAEKLTKYPKSDSGPGARCAMYIWELSGKCNVPVYARYSIRSKIFKGFDNSTQAAYFAKLAKKSKLVDDLKKKQQNKKPDPDKALPKEVGGGGGGGAGADNTALLYVGGGLLGLLIIMNANKK